MKRLAATLVALIGCASMNAMATCADPRVNGSALGNLVTGQTVCATANGDRWQEEHKSGGDLVDYKMGPNHAIDPSEKVGTWNISGNKVYYNYTGGGAYNYEIHGPDASGKYSFCGSTTTINGASFQAGGTKCP